MTVRPYVTFEDTQTPAEAGRIAAGWPARPSRKVDPDDFDPDVWDAAPPGCKLRGAMFEEQHAKALAILASVLSPPRITNVRWFTKDEFRAHERGKAAR